MSSGHTCQASAEHQDVLELLPWYVNCSISETDRQRVADHLDACPSCRAECDAEQRVHQAMSSDPGVEYMPSASLRRLHARIDELDRGADDAGARNTTASGSGAAAGTAGNAATHPAASAGASRATVPRRRLSWQGALAASVAVVALAGVVAVKLSKHPAADVPKGGYFTVTAPAPRPTGEVIRAVFAPSVTWVEVQAILDEAALRIVAGPSEAGVYSLAATSSRPVATSLQLLRAHQTVRFAESTQSSNGQMTGR